MKTVTDFPRQPLEFPDMGIVMPDGCRLSARVWMPVDADQDPVPAILEHLPYRKRDGTTARDSLTHPYFAGHGYACLRVDMRGNGDSDGLMEDEYSEQELQDACDVIAWAAAQPWCSGKVGMMGISWGGFNALQVAAKGPAALKAIITLCSTDDRYADDIHYKGGLLLNENMGWGATMLSYSSRPPDPAIVGDKWRAMWLERLEHEPFLPAVWLSHQTRDAYWKRGSVCEDFSAIKAAPLAIGGWGDGYKNAVSRLVAGIDAPAKGIVGPWIHKYPHFAVPKPAIGFLQEALRWWDHWLKDIETGVENDPAMRLYVMDSEPPRDWYEKRPGRWIAEPVWPVPDRAPLRLALGAGNRLAADATPMPPTIIASPQDCGLAGGEYCAIWLGPELPGDQRIDDEQSACFDSEPLDAPLDIVGAPVISLTLSADRPRAMVAVRLCDVQPDGASTRITYGVLNLCHRDSHQFPRNVVPGEPIQVVLQLDDIAYSVKPGNRLRVAISSTYWPLVWPSPEPVALTLAEGAIDLPVRPSGQGDEWSFAEPEAATPWKIETLRPSTNSRTVKRTADGRVRLDIVDDFGEVRDLDHGLVSGGTAEESWTIDPDDPLSAHGSTRWTQTLSRDGWSVSTETLTEMTSDATSFHLRGRIVAREGSRLVFERDFDETAPRGFI
ncbi:MAG: CocE/NonD family hydrolase [Alphaproteobacteria bacterium]|nr:CocE/NonD family hydrolase [Alphaproteobacteria bacterium]MBU0804470.1 CocE/NonD family hydrolase [Alphaproteobacteria bacterium]MBU0872162.1 CocE/NonD family hydrolase [Alphaproteobacteria bacterium]MBU1403254.1 CocE/NonD family hydrolase [Alphaproteobacteria bacterium]MBU1593038.1 CocE/NonD family hydrolase [Alphaproteobacteria bacterium]